MVAVEGMMVRARLLGAVAVAALAAATSGGWPAAASGPSQPAGGWGTARQVPVPQNQLGSVACVRSGFCMVVAGPDVMVARDGIWGRPQSLDLSALGTFRYPALDVVACPSARNCVVAGHYTAGEAGVEPEPFAVIQSHGKWGPAQPLGILSDEGSTNPVAKPIALACSSAGNCAVSVEQSNDNYESDGTLLASVQNGGKWHELHPQSRPAAGANGTSQAGPQPAVPELACTAKYCIGPEEYTPGDVTIERGGTWTVRAIPGLARGGFPMLASCAPGGICTIAGHETGLPGDPLFSISERHGSWGNVLTVPGPGPHGGTFNPTALSCPAAGYCTLGGFSRVPFIAEQRNGTWSRPHALPGMAAIDAPHQANLSTLYCTAPAECAIGGLGAMTPGNVSSQGYLDTETHGRWGKALIVPGITTLETGGGSSQIYTVACWAPGHCIAGGSYWSFAAPVTQYPFLTTQG